MLDIRCCLSTQTYGYLFVRNLISFSAVAATWILYCQSYVEAYAFSTGFLYITSELSHDEEKMSNLVKASMLIGQNVVLVTC